MALLQVDVVATPGASSFWLWFTFGGMFLATIAFAYLAASDPGGRYHHYVTCAVITFWAATWYVIMATGSGISLIEGAEGTRLFYFGRYWDWVVTTPLILLTLSWVALGGSIARNPRLVALILGADVLMILFGLAAGGTGSNVRWFWFLLSSAFFVGVLYLIWVPLREEARRGPTEGRPGLFFSLAALLTLLWVLYPVVFILGTEGISSVSNGVEVLFYAILDILSKIAFGLILIDGIRQGRAAR